MPSRPKEIPSVAHRYPTPPQNASASPPRATQFWDTRLPDFAHHKMSPHKSQDPKGLGMSSVKSLAENCGECFASSSQRSPSYLGIEQFVPVVLLVAGHCNLRTTELHPYLHPTLTQRHRVIHRHLRDVNKDTHHPVMSPAKKNKKQGGNTKTSHGHKAMVMGAKT